VRKEVTFVLEVWQTANRLEVSLSSALLPLFIRDFHITKAELDTISEVLEQEAFDHYKDNPRMLSSLKRMKEEWKL